MGHDQNKQLFSRPARRADAGANDQVTEQSRHSSPPDKKGSLAFRTDGVIPLDINSNHPLTQDQTTLHLTRHEGLHRVCLNPTAFDHENIAGTRERDAHDRCLRLRRHGSMNQPVRPALPADISATSNNSSEKEKNQKKKDYNRQPHHRHPARHGDVAIP